MAALVHDFFVPAVGLALVLAAGWRRLPPSPLRTAVQIAASLLFFLPQLAVFLLWDRSILLVLHQRAVAALWVLGMAGLMGWQALGRPGARPGMRRSGAERQGKRRLLLVVALAFAGFGLVLARDFAADALGAPIPVRGQVEQMWTRRSAKGFTDRYVRVDGETFQVTADLYGRLRPGDPLQGEAGAGSRTILRVER